MVRVVLSRVGSVRVLTSEARRRSEVGVGGSSLVLRLARVGVDTARRGVGLIEAGQVVVHLVSRLLHMVL